MILKPTPEMPEQTQEARKGNSILNRQSAGQAKSLPILRILKSKLEIIS